MPHAVFYIVWCLTAVCGSAVLTRQLIDWARARGMMDLPNERGSHARPTPRGGPPSSARRGRAWTEAAAVLSEPRAVARASSGGGRGEAGEEQRPNGGARPSAQAGAVGPITAQVAAAFARQDAVLSKQAAGLQELAGRLEAIDQQSAALSRQAASGLQELASRLDAVDQQGAAMSKQVAASLGDLTNRLGAAEGRVSAVEKQENAIAGQLGGVEERAQRISRVQVAAAALDREEVPDETHACLVACRRRRIGPFGAASPDLDTRRKWLATLARAGFGGEVSRRALAMSREDAQERLG